MIARRLFLGLCALLSIATAVYVSEPDPEGLAPAAEHLRDAIQRQQDDETMRAAEAARKASK